MLQDVTALICNVRGPASHFIRDSIRKITVLHESYLFHCLCELFIFLLTNYFVFAVSENKVYCHPSSVDSLTTSAGTEDHVSMGGFAARKVLKVVENVERGKCKQK